MPDLEIVDSTGVLLAEDDLDEVVVRRREPRFELGSEVAIRRNHAPLLMQTCACTLRWRRGDAVRTIAVDAGVIEVSGERITLAVTKRKAG